MVRYYVKIDGIYCNHCREMIEKALKALSGVSSAKVHGNIAFASRECFPLAEHVICDSFQNAIRNLHVTPMDYVVVSQLGQVPGSIGGGCSEGEVIREAIKLIGTGTYKTYEIDLTGDVAESEGMVCGGIMRVLIEDDV